MCKVLWTFQRAWGGARGEERGDGVGQSSPQDKESKAGIAQLRQQMKFRARAHKWTGSAKPCLGLSNINLRQVSEQVLDDSNQSLKLPQLTEAGHIQALPKWHVWAEYCCFELKESAMGTQWRSKATLWGRRRIRLGLLGWDSGWGSGHVLTTGQDPQNHVSESMHFLRRGSDALIRFSEEFMTHKRLKSVALKGERQSPGRQRMKKMCKALAALGSVLANMQSRHDWKFTFHAIILSFDK